MAPMKKMSSGLKNQAQKTTILEWNESINTKSLFSKYHAAVFIGVFI